MKHIKIVFTVLIFAFSANADQVKPNSPAWHGAKYGAITYGSAALGIALANFDDDSINGSVALISTSTAVGVGMGVLIGSSISRKQRRDLKSNRTFSSKNYVGYGALSGAKHGALLIGLPSILFGAMLGSAFDDWGSNHDPDNSTWDGALGGALIIGGIGTLIGVGTGSITGALIGSGYKKGNDLQVAPIVRPSKNGMYYGANLSMTF